LFWDNEKISRTRVHGTNVPGERENVEQGDPIAGGSNLGGEKRRTGTPATSKIMKTRRVPEPRSTARREDGKPVADREGSFH